jgi:thioesterase domain-containing protein
MSATPASRAARDRLREAQQAEARALGKVEVAIKTRLRAAERLGDADSALARAQAAVVESSGLERAAFLLDLDRAELRRRVRTAAAEVAPDGRATASRTAPSVAHRE